MLHYLRQWADLLDSRFRVPGTNIRFGLDPILSLIPGLGDIATPAFTVMLLVQAIRQGVPKVVLVRMIGNALLDALIGAVPVAGDVGDVFWKANRRNLSLIERHMHRGVQPTRGDYVFVGVAAVLLGLIVAVPVAIGVWMALWIWTHFI
jgi:hypothetical protein